MSEYTNYDGKYLKIRKAIYEAGFDEFCQAGSVNQFHKMNIVAESAVLGKRFWFCVEGGYNMKDELHISIRDLNTKAPDGRVPCKNQEEMVERIREIRNQITAAKAKKGGINMELRQISKKEAREKYGVCTTGASSLCQFFLRSDGCVVDENNLVRYCPPLAAHRVAEEAAEV